MSEEKNKKLTKNILGGSVTVNGQYIKDLSFENLKAPLIYTMPPIPPKLDLAVDINATKLQDDIFEVEFRVTAGAEREGEKIFVIELVYAGIFTIQGIEGSVLEEVLFIHCPSLLFPFARRIIAETTRDANFPQLMMDPIDFETMYNSRKEDIKRNN